MPGPAPKFSKTPAAVGEVGDIGNATADLLAEVGYDETALARLRESGAIG
jgi:crotonobetainyl-CoA:carnitine CoA-transferase CaiB-like acyl-CoA transferase